MFHQGGAHGEHALPKRKCSILEIHQAGCAFLAEELVLDGSVWVPSWRFLDKRKMLDGERRFLVELGGWKLELLRAEFGTFKPEPTQLPCIA